VGIVLGIIAFVLSILLLEYIIRTAINSSRMAKKLDEVVWELQQLRKELKARDERDHPEKSDTGRVIDAEA
jgi:hypothetical protein